MKQSERVARRRQRVRELRALGPEWTLERIADEVGASRPTVVRDLREGPAEVAPPPPPEGNERALTHGANSEQRLGPLREEWALEVKRRWPWVDDVRAAILSDRLARLESARRWLDSQSGVVRGKDGVVWPVAARLETWANRAESVIAELELERRSRGAGDPLAGLGDLSKVSPEVLRQVLQMLEEAMTVDGDVDGET